MTTHTTPEAAREAGTPWYHGVKWTTETDLPYHEMPRVFGSDGALICVVGNMAGEQDVWEIYAALVAAAPETATERDALKAQMAELTAQNERQREALKAIMHAVCGETGLVWVPWD